MPATTTAVRTHKRPVSASAKLPSPSSLRDVRTALELHHQFSVRSILLHLPAFFLCTGILIFVQLFVVRSVMEQLALRSLVASHTLPVMIQQTALSSQRHVFLQALLTLPQVESAEYLTKEHLFERERQLQPELLASVTPSAFTDRMEVTLRSQQDFGAFFSFLRRPELSSVIVPNFLWELPGAQEKFMQAVSAHQSTLRMLLWYMAGAFVLLALGLSLSMRTRMQGMRKQVQTLLLLGTDLRRLRRPFFLESAALILTCLVASIVIVVLLSPLLSQGSFLFVLRAAPWILLLEVCACLAFSALAVAAIPLASRSIPSQ